MRCCSRKRSTPLICWQKIAPYLRLAPVGRRCWTLIPLPSPPARSAKPPVLCKLPMAMYAAPQAIAGILVCTICPWRVLPSVTKIVPSAGCCAVRVSPSAYRACTGFDTLLRVVIAEAKPGVDSGLGCGFCSPGGGIDGRVKNALTMALAGGVEVIAPGFGLGNEKWYLLIVNAYWKPNNILVGRQCSVLSGP